MGYVEDEYQKITCPYCKKEVVLLLQFDGEGNLKWCDVNDLELDLEKAPKFEYKSTHERKLANARIISPAGLIAMLDFTERLKESLKKKQEAKDK